MGMKKTEVGIDNVADLVRAWWAGGGSIYGPIPEASGGQGKLLGSPPEDKRLVQILRANETAVVDYLMGRSNAKLKGLDS